MNIFEKFLISKEVSIKDGELKVDQQRIMFLPANFWSLYSLNFKNNFQETAKIYKSVKEGLSGFSMPLGKKYGLSVKDFLDRWVKYCAFGGLGIVEYKLIENDYGFLSIKDLSSHIYLKKIGIKEPLDIMWEGIIAGSLSNTFNKDVHVIESKCICNGSDMCIFNWGSKEYLMTKFSDLVYKRFGVGNGFP